MRNEDQFGANGGNSVSNFGPIQFKEKVSQEVSYYFAEFGEERGTLDRFRFPTATTLVLHQFPIYLSSISTFLVMKIIL